MEVLAHGWLQKRAKSALSLRELALVFAYRPRRNWCIRYVFHSRNQAIPELIIAIHVPGIIHLTPPVYTLRANCKRRSSAAQPKAAMITRAPSLCVNAPIHWALFSSPIDWNR